MVIFIFTIGPQFVVFFKISTTLTRENTILLCPCIVLSDLATNPCPQHHGSGTEECCSIGEKFSSKIKKWHASKGLFIHRGLRKALGQDLSWHKNLSGNQPAQLWTLGWESHTHGPHHSCGLGKKALSVILNGYSTQAEPFSPCQHVKSVTACHELGRPPFHPR